MDQVDEDASDVRVKVHHRFPSIERHSEGACAKCVLRLFANKIPAKENNTQEEEKSSGGNVRRRKREEEEKTEGGGKRARR